jgi:hypothetical protein
MRAAEGLMFIVWLSRRPGATALSRCGVINATVALTVVATDMPNDAHRQLAALLDMHPCLSFSHNRTRDHLSYKNEAAFAADWLSDQQNRIDVQAAGIAVSLEVGRFISQRKFCSRLYVCSFFNAGVS